MDSTTIQQHRMLENALATLVRTATTAQQLIASSVDQSQAIVGACTRPYRSEVTSRELKKLSHDSKNLEATCAQVLSLVNQILGFSNDSAQESGRISYTTFHTAHCKGLYDRVSKVEILAHLVRELCWSANIQDCVGADKPKWQTTGNEEQKFLNWTKRNGLDDLDSNPDRDTNIVLRCYLMAEVYQLLHMRIFVSCNWQAKKTAKDTSKAISDVIMDFFKRHKKSTSLRAQLSTIIDRAIDLRTMLENDDTGKYAMIVPGLHYPNNEMRVLEGDVRVMGLVGAPHRDNSSDVVRLVMFGGLQIEDLDLGVWDRCRAFETKPWVMVYRPAKSEEREAHEMLTRGSV